VGVIFVGGLGRALAMAQVGLPGDARLV